MVCYRMRSPSEGPHQRPGQDHEREEQGQGLSPERVDDCGRTHRGHHHRRHRRCSRKRLHRIHRRRRSCRRRRRQSCRHRRQHRRGCRRSEGGGDAGAGDSITKPPQACPFCLEPRKSPAQVVTCPSNLM
uniref:Protamine-2 n=1 Tax=Tokudaia muenninki TaxID=742503 RepID=A0A0S3NU68_9MURI|nr:protamine 2 [Tokudaia muenninki]